MTTEFPLPDDYVSPPADAADQISARAGWARSIDEAVQAIYARPMLLSKEYEAREADALSYQAAGYAGDVPARVSGFATPAGLSATVATNLILAQAAALRTALEDLSDLRMQKYGVVRASVSTAEAHAVYQSAMVAIAAIATGLG